MREFVDYCFFISKFFGVYLVAWFVVEISSLTEEPTVLILVLVLVILIRVRARTSDQNPQDDP
jgi:hypothetical protein